MSQEAVGVNSPEQRVKKRPVIYIVKIDLTRETLGKLKGLEKKVREILGKKTRISHDKMILLLMLFSRADEVLTQWTLDANTPKETEENE